MVKAQRKDGAKEAWRSRALQVRRPKAKDVKFRELQMQFGRLTNDARRAGVSSEVLKLTFTEVISNFIIKQLPTDKKMKKVIDFKIFCLAYQKMKYVPKLRADYGRTHILLVVGLPRSGKTTVSAQIALYSAKDHQTVVIISADPRSYNFLHGLAAPHDIEVHGTDAEEDMVVIAEAGLAAFGEMDVIVVDTLGPYLPDRDSFLRVGQLQRVLVATQMPVTTILVLNNNHRGEEVETQASWFKKMLEPTFLIASHVYGNGKSGPIVNVANTLGCPLRYVSFGQSLDKFSDQVWAEFFKNMPFA